VGPVAGWLVTAAGAAVVLLALRDIFHTLWHPSGRGGFSRRVMSAVWRIGRPRRGRRRVGVLAGPLAMGFVVVTWVALVALGWTLVYWPHLAEGFVLGANLGRDTRGGLLDALYLSMVTVATLGFGDIIPPTSGSGSPCPSRRCSASRCSPPPSRGCCRSTPR
jgi:Ion channel